MNLLEARLVYEDKIYPELLAFTSLSPLAAPITIGGALGGALAIDRVKKGAGDLRKASHIYKKSRKLGFSRRSSMKNIKRVQRVQGFVRKARPAALVAAGVGGGYGVHKYRQRRKNASL